jgi:hypothetical protein
MADRPEGQAMLPIVPSNQRFAVTTTAGCGDMIQDWIAPPQTRLVKIQHSFGYVTAEEKGRASILKEIQTNSG